MGTETIHLNLVRFTNGIDFTFPGVELSPGACCLVVKDAIAFETRYGLGLPIVGEYAGSLANEGEKITLVDAVGATIQSFRYEDDWYDPTDGQGHSLISGPGRVRSGAVVAEMPGKPASIGGLPRRPRRSLSDPFMKGVKR